MIKQLSLVLALCMSLTGSAMADITITTNNHLGPLTGSGCSATIVCPPDITVTGEINNLYVTGHPSVNVVYPFCETPQVSYKDEVTPTDCGDIIDRYWFASSVNTNITGSGSTDINFCVQTHNSRTSMRDNLSSSSMYQY